MTRVAAVQGRGLPFCPGLSRGGGPMKPVLVYVLLDSEESGAEVLPVAPDRLLALLASPV